MDIMTIRNIRLTLMFIVGPPGSAVIPQPTGAEIPKLFKPLKIRGVTLHNRITVSNYKC